MSHGEQRILVTAPVGELIIWWGMSALSYMCFLYLPGRLARHPSVRKANPSRAAVTMLTVDEGNDLAKAGGYAHWALWCWIAYDILLRLACLVLLAQPNLERDGLWPPWPVTAELVQVLRSTVGTADPEAASAATYRTLSLSLSVLSVIVASVVAYRTHTRKYLRGELPEQQEVRMDSGEIVPVQYRRSARLLPRWFPFIVWSCVFCSAFAWKRALPRLLSTLFPAGTLLLVGYCMMIP